MCLSRPYPVAIGLGKDSNSRDRNPGFGIQLSRLQMPDSRLSVNIDISVCIYLIVSDNLLIAKIREKGPLGNAQRRDWLHNGHITLS